MNTKEIYITLEGDRKVTLNDLIITWADRHGDHTGKVIDYGKTAERGGSPVAHEKDVYIVDCGDDGIRELRRHEMRDIIESIID